MDKIAGDIHRWQWRPWLWVLLCSMAIFATVPIARGIQRFIYNTFSPEFFTYIVISVISIGFVSLIYALIFRLKVRKPSQYLWIFLCSGLYIYFTLQLREHPEEAVHFLEFGLLAYLLFNALSRRIQDWTVYITALLFVVFIGTMDEFLQWLMPKRYWDYRDVGLNSFAGAVLLLAIWKGIRPGFISRPVSRISVRMLVRIVTADLLFLGFCLSNTPELVARYTGIIKPLWWLRDEEPMTRFEVDPIALWLFISVVLIVLWRWGRLWQRHLDI